MAAGGDFSLEGGGLVEKCIEAASATAESVDKWRRQCRTLERLPSQLADALFRRLVIRRLLFPSLLEVFQHSVEEIDLKGESYVDAEWMAYLGAFRYLRSLRLADCRGINNAALWPVTGMYSLKELDLSRCSKVTDAGIRHVISIHNLEKLRISETGLSSDGVALLSSLQNLLLLDVGGIPVTDKALSSLQVLTKLEYLDLWGSRISNNGVAILKMFPRLSFLNLAWTNVTKLPNLPSISCLDMSNCTIHSIFDEKCILNVPLEKFVALGATFVNVDDAFSNVDTSCITFLDISSSSICDFQFLDKMNMLEHLNLSFSRTTDSLIEYVTKVGTGLKYLDLSNTMLTSQAVCLLAGKFMNLETLSLSHTAIDDVAISYIGMMPSLRVIDLSHTNIKGLACWSGENSVKASSFTALQNLNHLESLNLEETQVRDEVLNPLGFLGQLRYLYLKSDFLSDVSLYALSSLSNLKFLGFCGAVITNSGLLLYKPPPTLKVLDLRGCWLLTKDAVSSFRKIHPQLEVRHEHVQMLKTDRNARAVSSPLHGIHSSKLRYKGVASGFPRVSFVDERIKYSREELLELQVSPLSRLSVHDQNELPTDLRKV